MNIYIAILLFILGSVHSLLLVYLGYRFGYRAAYEVHSDEQGEGLFPDKRDPAEFGLLPEKEKD